MRILILGGTTEASRLASSLAGRADVEATLSYAGRTEAPATQPIPVRVGGFGGIDGLAAYLRDNAIDLLIDATHPFAARISVNAAAAADLTGTPIVAFTRPPWSRIEGDRWIEVVDNAEALAAIGPKAARVFLTIGRLDIGDFCALNRPVHHYVIRTIDPPSAEDMPAHHRLILARGTFALDDEIQLMRDEHIDVLITKNSGGEATYAKVAAARTLGLPVIMVTPPARPAVRQVHSLDDCLAAIEAHGSLPSTGTERRV